MVMMTNLYRNTFILRRCILRRKFPNNFERVYRTFNKSFHNETDWTKRTKPGLFNLSCKFSVSLLSVCVFYNLYRKTKNEDVVDYGHGLKIALENAFVVKAASPSVGKRSQFNFIADIVEQTQPAVVFIEVVRGRGFGQTSSSGSGFIVRPDGLILTNAHVVAGASRVQVYLSNGQKVQGTVQAVDQVCDLATVKVNERNLQTLTLGKSSEVRPGEWVVALGSPFNLQKTVTAGIVSNAGRETMGNLTKSPPMIQHDAVINVGNSGGPLINLDGEAIGINTMTLTSGISFALPADLAADFLNRAKRVEGKFSPPSSKKRYMGLSVMTLTPDLQMDLRRRVSNFPSKVEQGILIVAVVSHSPAHYAGLSPGDVITHINGQSVTSTSQYFKAIEREEKLTLKIARENGTFTVTVTPEEVD